MEKIQDMVISVAEKEGWAVTIEEQNELRITFNFALIPQHYCKLNFLST